MKKILPIIQKIFVCVLVLGATSAMAQTDIKREFRAAWVSTVYCLDWPADASGKALQGTTETVASQQKARLNVIFNNLKTLGFNAVFFQVRPMSDALYNSSIEPTSSYLTGTRGAAATWDPLEYAVMKAHQLGLELHAWVNPYRWAGATSIDWNTPWDKEVKENGWILTTDKGKILNPGLQAVENHIVKVCKEIISNYQVDGLVFDDYFYNNGTPENNTAGDWELYQSSGTKLTLAAWRRQNVNNMVKAVYDMVQATKPYVRFGISPAGVASGGAKDAGVTAYVGASDWQYAGIYSDPLAWLKQGTIDYISPQLYWNTTHKTNPFGPLTQWWSNTAKHFNRHHYASHSISALGSSNTRADWEEYALQMQYSRDYTQNNAPGCVFFRMGFISGPNASGLGSYLKSQKFTSNALPPEITWKPHEGYGTVENISLKKNILSWTDTSDDPTVRYTVYAIPDSVDYEDALRSDGDGIKAEYLQGISYKASFSLSSVTKTGHGYAVCILDGYGKEYAPQLFNITGIHNPTASTFTLWLQGRTLRLSQEASEIAVYSMSGMQLAKFRHADHAYLDLPKGIYVVQAKSESGERFTKKFVLY